MKAREHQVAIPPAILAAIHVSFDHIADDVEKSDRIAWREELFQRLRSPASELLFEHGRSVGLTDETIVQLADKVCPLALTDEIQYR